MVKLYIAIGVLLATGILAAQIISNGGGGGGSTIPAAPANSVQWNNANSFGGSANFTWDNDGTLLVQNTMDTAKINIRSTTNPGLDLYGFDDGTAEIDVGMSGGYITSTASAMLLGAAITDAISISTTTAGITHLTDTVIASGKALQGDTTSAHTWLLGAYDNDTGPAYVTFMTFLNGNSPKLTIQEPAGGGTVEFKMLETTGSATGKKVVCVDTATGRLYASSTGTDCSN